MHIHNNNQEFSILLDYISNFQFSQAPRGVIHQAKRAILDNISAMILGASEKDIPDVLPFIQSTGCRSESASIVGRTQKCSFPDAVFANSSLCQGHDANDGFAPKADGRSHPNHPGRIIVPAALGIAEHYRLSGKELISLVITGYEAAWRIYDLPSGDPYLSIIPALLCGRVLQFTTAQYCNAAGLALYQAPAFERLNYTGKGMDDYALTTGNVARTGIDSALLAFQGFQCSTLTDTDAGHIKVDVEGFDSSYAVDNLYFKPFPACRSIHGPIEAAVELKNTYSFSCKDIESVEIEMANQGMYTAIPVDKETVTRISCAANPRYMTACALIDGAVLLKRFKNAFLKDDEVFDVVSRISVTGNEDFTKRYGMEGRPCRVTVRLADGRTISEENQFAKGAPKNPMSDEEIFRKLEWYSPEGLSDKQQKQIMSFIFSIEKVPETSRLMDLVRFAAR